MQPKERDDMNHDNAEERRKKNQREPRRDTRPSKTSEPIPPPLDIDGPELVRDSHC
jgi:hypothetical protein